jgi:hypothetical protein
LELRENSIDMQKKLVGGCKLYVWFEYCTFRFSLCDSFVFFFCDSFLRCVLCVAINAKVQHLLFPLLAPISPLALPPGTLLCYLPLTHFYPTHNKNTTCIPFILFCTYTSNCMYEMW